jgi:hypothetical protein
MPTRDETRTSAEVSRRRKQSARALLLEAGLLLIVVAIGYWVLVSGLAADMGRWIGESLEGSIRRSPVP